MPIYRRESLDARGYPESKRAPLWGWRWSFRNGKGFSVTYDVNTLDAASPILRLSYSWIWTSTGKEDSENYSIRLTTTRPRFGGLRWWFICPLTNQGRSCGRRVGKLYLPPHGRYFGCRHCYDLTYTSCQDSHKFDSFYRMTAQSLGCDVATIKWALKQGKK